MNEKLRDLKIRGAIARKSERRGVASVQRMAIPRAYSVTKARLSRHVSIILCQIVCRCRGTSCSFLDPLALAPRYLCVTVSIEILCRSPVVHLLPRLSPSTRIFFFFFFLRIIRSFLTDLILLDFTDILPRIMFSYDLLRSTSFKRTTESIRSTTTARYLYQGNRNWRHAEKKILPVRL